MADLSQLRNFARRYQLNLTGPLTKSEVQVLAEEWVPEMRFHEDENFHPISVMQWLSPGSFGAPVRYEDRLKIVDEQNPSIELSAAPPVFFQSHDQQIKREPDAPEVTSHSYMSNVSELYDSPSRFDPRDRSPSGMAQIYFGSNNEVNGVKLPRISPITIGAEWRDLREALRFQAFAYQAANAGQFPSDDQGELLDAILGAPLFNAGAASPQHLTQLVRLVDAAYKVDQGVMGAVAERDGLIKELVADGILTEPEWKVIQDFVFLEYYFAYAYNDIREHREWQEFLFGNHEGDIEGIGVVFDRSEIAQISARPDRENFLRTVLAPRFFVSSSHNPSQGLDQCVDFRLVRILLGTAPGGPFTLADFKAKFYKVWIMPGSHATYLAPGNYDNLEHIDELLPPAIVTAGGSTVAGAGVLGADVFAITVLLLFLEHLLTPDEDTSDNGVHGTPPTAQPGTSPPPTDIPIRVLTTPLSQSPDHIYHPTWRPGNPKEIDVPLAVRAFPGRWGVDGGSPRWNNKTARFVKKLAETYFEA